MWSLSRCGVVSPAVDAVTVSTVDVAGAVASHSCAVRTTSGSVAGALSRPPQPGMPSCMSVGTDGLAIRAARASTAGPWTDEACAMSVATDSLLLTAVPTDAGMDAHCCPIALSTSRRISAIAATSGVDAGSGLRRVPCRMFTPMAGWIVGRFNRDEA